MQVGWETRGLQVFPADVAERDLWDTPPDSQDEARPTERAQARLAAARNEGRVSEVVMLAKQLARALASSQLTGPAQLLLGIAGAQKGAEKGLKLTLLLAIFSTGLSFSPVSSFCFFSYNLCRKFRLCAHARGLLQSPRPGAFR